MSSIQQPTHHLAICIHRLSSGEPDIDELVELLDRFTGQHQWLLTADWLFRAPPIQTRPGQSTIPAVLPEGPAERLRASRPYRVTTGEVILDTELRQWRWVAAQVHPFADGRGLFPWEVAVQENEHLQRYVQNRRAEFIASTP